MVKATDPQGHARPKSGTRERREPPQQAGDTRAKVLERARRLGEWGPDTELVATSPHAAARYAAGHVYATGIRARGYRAPDGEVALQSALQEELSTYWASLEGILRLLNLVRCSARVERGAAGEDRALTVEVRDADCAPKPPGLALFAGGLLREVGAIDKHLIQRLWAVRCGSPCYAAFDVPPTRDAEQAIKLARQTLENQRARRSRPLCAGFLGVWAALARDCLAFAVANPGQYVVLGQEGGGRLVWPTDALQVPGVRERYAAAGIALAHVLLEHEDAEAEVHANRQGLRDALGRLAEEGPAALRERARDVAFGVVEERELLGRLRGGLVATPRALNDPWIQFALEPNSHYVTVDKVPHRLTSLQRDVLVALNARRGMWMLESALWGAVDPRRASADFPPTTAVRSVFRDSPLLDTWLQRDRRGSWRLAPPERRR